LEQILLFSPFQIANKPTNGWLTRCVGFPMAADPRQHKGLLKRYLSKVSGLSMAQVERYIRQFLEA
jgi:hypothetical protein